MRVVRPHVDYLRVREGQRMTTPEVDRMVWAAAYAAAFVAAYHAEHEALASCDYPDADSRRERALFTLRCIPGPARACVEIADAAVMALHPDEPAPPSEDVAKAWIPVLPMRQGARTGASLAAHERREVDALYPDWRPHEIDATRWERSQTFSKPT